jgi:hypothetical protein
LLQAAVPWLNFYKHKSNMNISLLFVTIAGLLAGCKNEPGKAENINLLTEKEVINFITSYDDMWAIHDTVAMKEAISENYIYFTSTGNITDRARILSWFTPADKYKVDTAARSEISITIHGNIAVVSSRWIGSGSFGGERFNDDQRCSLVIQKETDKLKLIAEHCTQIAK